MALLWIEGFEGFGTTIGNAPSPTGIIGRKYPVINRESEMKIQNGRNGFCLAIYYAIGAESYIQSPDLTTDNTLVFGAAIKILSTPSVLPSKLMMFYDGTSLAVNIRVNTNGTLSVYLDNVLLGTSALALSSNTWYYLELKVLTHASAGTVDLVINTDNWLSLSGIDTQIGSHAYATAFRLGSSNVTTLYDDLYLLDSSGSINNDFLGIRKVSAIRPNAAGDSTQWIPDSGTNYDRINEMELDEDTSYVETGTTTNKDLYNYDPAINMTSIDGIQIITEVKATSGSMELQNITKSGSTENAQSCGTIISTDYVTCSSISEVNPDTSNPYTPAEIDAAQFGIKAI